MEWIESIPDLIGTDPASITWWQMTIRAAVVFVFGLLLVRIFGQRAFGRGTVLDVILAIVVGSNLSRTMTAGAPSWPTLAATTGLVLLYWVFDHAAALASAQLAGEGRRHPAGQRRRMDRRAMLRTGISKGDIEEAMRRSGVESLEEVRSAYLERNGKISVLTWARLARNPVRWLAFWRTVSGHLCRPDASDLEFREVAHAQDTALDRPHHLRHRPARRVGRPRPDLLERDDFRSTFASRTPPPAPPPKGEGSDGAFLLPPPSGGRVGVGSAAGR